VAVPLSGAGRHTLAVLHEDPNKIEFLGKDGLLMLPVSYVVAVALSKGVILQFYLRIFRFGYTRWISGDVGVIVTIHAIVVIFVTIFANISYQNWWSSLDPKIIGSWNLHTLLRLDSFIMLSSIAWVLGSSG
jgi:hypothetical protein